MVDVYNNYNFITISAGRSAERNGGLENIREQHSEIISGPGQSVSEKFGRAAYESGPVSGKMSQSIQRKPTRSGIATGHKHSSNITTFCE